MRKEVTIEELREKLDEILAEIKAGETVAIVEHGKTIGTMAPTTRSSHGGVRFPFRNFDFGSRPETLTVDVVDFIREDRDAELKKYGL